MKGRFIQGSEGQDQEDISYIDGAQNPTEFGFMFKTRWSLMILL